MFVGVIVTAALAVVFVGGLVYFSDEARTKRALKAAPVVAIAAAPEGEVVRITGRLRPLADLLQAPLTGRRCAYFVAIVEEPKSTGKSKRWEEVARLSEGVEFFIEDPTGKIRVHAGLRCQVVVTRDSHSRSGTFDDPTAAERRFLARAALEETGLLGFNRSLRYTEGVLEPDEEITALGRVRRGVDGDLVLGPTAEGPVLLSDDPGTVARR